MQSTAEIAPPDAKHAVLNDVFGFDTFRPGQEQVVDALLAGQNVLTVMPTGSGKSLCFQIPALVTGGLTIVVSPLVALMEDQVAALKLAGVAADAINSSRPREDNVAAWRRAAAGETRLLYMAPERLMTERMLVALQKLDVRMFAVDEAHCISQWGPAFRPEYEALSQLRDIFPDIPVAALTATADAVTRDDIVARLFGGRAETVVLGFDRPNIRLSVEMKQDWKQQMTDFLARHEGSSGIVYCLSRKKTEETARYLRDRGVNALPYHAGMDQVDRQANQNAFMTDPGVVIVATIAFGMGIDKSDVRFVLHVDLPGSVEAYYQKIGRAGRDGAPADAHMIYGLQDIHMRRVFIEDEDSGPDRKRREHKRLDALVGYCEAPTCRRRALLEYFGEKIGNYILDERRLNMATAPGRSDRQGMTVLELMDKFPTEDAAREWFESIIWPDGRHCPHCGSTNTVENHGVTADRPYHCRDCHQHFSVRKGTLMERSKIPMQKWAIAIYLHMTSLKGVSSMKLHRDIGVTQKTAWFMLQRIREAFRRDDDDDPMGGPVEVDETYVGGRRKNMPKAKRERLKGRGAVGKAAVVGAKDRETNRVQAEVVPDTRSGTLQGFIAGHADAGAKIYTDDHGAYAGMPFDHETVQHSAGEYVRGMAHTNGIESFWSVLKRAHKGVYHKFSMKHLQRYVTDFAGRHNVRDMDTMMQMQALVAGMAGKRLMYRDLIADNGLASGARS